MAENKWVCLGLCHPTYRGPITPLITGRGPPCKNVIRHAGDDIDFTGVEVGWLVGWLEN